MLALHDRPQFARKSDPSFASRPLLHCSAPNCTRGISLFAPSEMYGDSGSIMTADEESLPRGVCRRSTTGNLYFELRSGKGKLYSTLIKSPEEGGLCYDIARRYSERCMESATRIGTPGGERGKRKAPLELNYPDYSRSLVLDDLPWDFDSRDNKEATMEIILKQARAAAKGLPKQAQTVAKSRAKVQKHSARGVGNQSVDNRSFPQQNACYNPSRGAKEHADLAGVHRGNDVQKFIEDVCEHSNQCRIQYALKVSERKALERTVKNMQDGLGIISIPKSGPDKFHQHMALFKLLVSRDEKVSLLLERFEQEYRSEELICWKLRKTLEGHNLMSIPESLMGDGNKMTGRRRANEEERLPSVLEICPVEEQNSCNMPTEVSAFYVPPTSSLALDVMPYGENRTAIPSVVETDMSQPVASYEFALGDTYTNEEVQSFWSSLGHTPTHIGYRMENEDDRPAEVCVNSNAEAQFHDHLFLDWTDTLFHTDQDGL